MSSLFPRQWIRHLYRQLFAWLSFIVWKCFGLHCSILTTQPNRLRQSLLLFQVWLLFCLVLPRLVLVVEFALLVVDLGQAFVLWPPRLSDHSSGWSMTKPKTPKIRSALSLPDAEVPIASLRAGCHLLLQHPLESAQAPSIPRSLVTPCSPIDKLPPLHRPSNYCHLHSPSLASELWRWSIYDWKAPETNRRCIQNWTSSTQELPLHLVP